jgi:hypothetical protein
MTNPSNAPPIQVPPLISAPPRYENLNSVGRLLNLIVAIACLGILITAFRLPPIPTGIGTHTGLHMQDCAWLYRIGIPCPSCGMTTSFAWFVRGNIVASFYVQPFGFVLALITTIVFWVAIYAAISGKPVTQLLHRLPAKYTWGAILVLAMSAWAWKIFIHLHGVDGWR